MAATIPVPKFKLNNGHEMPAVGLGCWMGGYGGGERAEQMVKLALKAGYRHIDTAFGYGNEEHVGKAIRESGISREEIFVTTKLTGKHHGSVNEGFELSLKALDIGYIDLYLMHWPQATNEKGEAIPPEQSPTFVETWLAMEKLLDTGKVKSIGVSNFSVKNLEILLAKAHVVPATNQVELHPCLPQFKLKAYCDVKGILLTAYSPFGQPEPGVTIPFFADPFFSEMASKNNVSVGTLLVSWGVQRGTAVIPKSEKEERIVQNISIIELDEEDMEELDAFHRKPGMHRSLLRYYSKGGVFGWTFEQMGWNGTEDRICTD